MILKFEDVAIVFLRVLKEYMCICVVLGNVTFKVLRRSLKLSANCIRNELNKHMCIENSGEKRNS